jgi:hypothetical protein
LANDQIKRLLALEVSQQVSHALGGLCRHSAPLFRVLLASGA